MIDAIVKTVLYNLNDAVTIQGQNTTINTSQELTFFGANFFIGGIAYAQPWKDGKTYPVTVDCCEKDCEAAKNTATWFKLKNKSGLLFFEHTKSDFTLSKFGGGIERCIDTIRLIVWLDKCKLNLEPCVSVFKDIYPYLQQKLPIRKFNLDSSTVEDLCCGQKGYDMKDISVKIIGKPLHNDRTVLRNYTGINSTYLATNPYEYFSIDLEVSYQICYGSVTKPDFSDSADGDCNACC